MHSEQQHLAPPMVNTTQSGRLLSLDVFRGLTVAAMLLVNDPGDWDHIFAPLTHSKWDGCTPTDLIFPSFLFMVGISAHLSLHTRLQRGDRASAVSWQIVRRGLILCLLGLFIAWFPGYEGTLSDHTHFLSKIQNNLLHLRIPGVLQRIGLTYMIASLLSLHAAIKTQWLIIFGILLGYWALMMGMPVPGLGATGLAAVAQPGNTLSAFVDRSLFDWGQWGNHLWQESKNWDPEGPLSSVSAIATAMLGLAAGRLLTRPQPLRLRIAKLSQAGLVGMLVGLVWGIWFPINKSLWSSSFVVFTAGTAAIGLALTMWLVEIRGFKRWVRPWLPFGVNPIVAYVGGELMSIVLGRLITVNVGGHDAGIGDVIYRAGFASWLHDATASLGYAIAFVLVWMVILDVLYRRKIFIRV